MKLEIGHTYLNREGDKVKIVDVRVHSTHRYLGSDEFCYAEDGRFDDEPGDFDLIEECEPDPQEPTTMPRDISLDCLLESFENLLAAREHGDEAKTKAAAEFRKWLRAEVTACAAETEPFMKRLAEALQMAARSMNQTTVHRTGVSSLGDFEQLPNPDFQIVAGVLAEAEARGLV